MPHKCANCGREYRNGAKELLAGCAECGGKKFYFVPYVRRQEHTRPPEPEKELPVEAPAPEVKPAKQTDQETGIDRLESVRIVSPGTYELNISKMANSDERVVGIGGEGSYIVDLLSMVKPKTGKKPKKSK